MSDALDPAVGQTRDAIAMSLMQMWGQDPNTVSPDLLAALAPTGAQSSYPYYLWGGNGAPGTIGLNDMGAPTNAPDVGLVSSTPASPGIPGSGNILGDPGAINDALGTVVSPGFSPDPNTGPPTGYFDSSIANTIAANNPNAPPDTVAGRYGVYEGTPTPDLTAAPVAPVNNAPVSPVSVTVTATPDPGGPTGGPTGGAPGPGDVSAGYGTGYGQSTGTYGGDIAGGPGTGFGTGTGPGFGGHGDPGAGYGGYDAGPSGFDAGPSGFDSGPGSSDSGPGGSGNTGAGGGGDGGGK